MSEQDKDDASSLLQQADALMRRHRRVFVAGAETPKPVGPVSADNGDVPVLTEVVEADQLIATVSNAAEADIKARIHAAVGANDAELARALERWISTQLPDALAQALDSVAEQLKLELAARLRAELLTRPMFDQQPLFKPAEPKK
ncbi:MAG: hypothetical protein K2Q19_05015 [Rhodocyclaceae bacterium]|jgi:hypothetical protein|nr:hypothetical protein [Rhodocyclaceae bacterium]